MPKIEILSAQELKANYEGPDGEGEYPAYDREEWREAVMHCHTIEGYWDWVHTALTEEANAEADAEEDMDVSQVSYSNKGTCTPIEETAISAPPACDDIRDRVVQAISEMLGHAASAIKDSDTLVDNLGADSLDQIEMVMAIEEEFEFEISDEEAEKLTTVGEVVAFVRSRVK
jgi:acyl carrier protein